MPLIIIIVNTRAIIRLWHNIYCIFVVWLTAQFDTSAVLNWCSKYHGKLNINLSAFICCISGVWNICSVNATW